MLEAEATTGRVLVVEDDEEIADVLRRTLRQEGHEVRTAGDGQVDTVTVNGTEGNDTINVTAAGGVVTVDGGAAGPAGGVAGAWAKARLVTRVAAVNPAAPTSARRDTVAPLPSSNRRWSVGRSANVFDSCMIPPTAIRMAGTPPLPRISPRRFPVEPLLNWVLFSTIAGSNWTPQTEPSASGSSTTTRSS